MSKLVSPSRPKQQPLPPPEPLPPPPERSDEETQRLAEEQRRAFSSTRSRANNFLTPGGTQSGSSAVRFLGYSART